MNLEEKILELQEQARIAAERANEQQRIIDEHKRVAEEALNKLEELKKAPEVSPPYRRDELIEEINKLHSYLSPLCLGISANLRLLHVSPALSRNEFVRKAFYLSLLGIVCTRISTFQSFQQVVQHFIPDEFDFVLAIDIWSSMEEKYKLPVLEWIEAFVHSSAVLPEALISQNLWYYVLKKTLLSIEATCRVHQDCRKKLQCFGEFCTDTIKAIGKRFITDLVYLINDSGIPLFMVEIAHDSDSHGRFPNVHKDMKKLAVQMGGALMHLLGAIRLRGDAIAKEYVPRLRVFGALISGTQIQFCSSRIQLDTNGRFMIIFETRSDHWTFDLFTPELVSPAAPEPFIASEPVNLGLDLTAEASTDSIAEINRIEMEEERGAMEESVPRRARPARPINIQGLATLTNFIGHIHSYYSHLPDSVSDFYANPGNHDENLAYTGTMHTALNTTTGPSPSDQHTDFIETSSHLVSTDAPTDYLFPTLPLIRLIKPASKDNSQYWRWDSYLEGRSFGQVYDLVEKRTSTEYLSRKRIIMRSQFILGILMAIFKVHRAGFVINEFNCEDICYRDELFCIKTYRNVVSASRPGAPDFKTTLKAFCELYFSIWFLDTYMTDGDTDYTVLRRLELVTLRKVMDFNAAENDTAAWWKRLFSDALEAYKLVLDQYSKPSDNCTFLLNSILAEDLVTGESSQPQVASSGLSTLQLSRQSLGSSGSSIERMEIKSESKEEEQEKTSTSLIQPLESTLIVEG